ncbi:cob(I)yrinic acid a,c-diamide adenosyltransferase [bacterium]|nr:cob(I)yrinic acid a,c-diamide adenosyltransferase [bacterium]
MKIYTKTGDKGTTSLLGGTRVSKAHQKIEAYGTVDELNSTIGLLRTETPKYDTVLKNIQNRLFNVGSLLATEREVSFQLPEIDEKDILYLEEQIDEMDKDLHQLKNFVLPGGSRSNGLAHMCRSICRRAERRVVVLEGDYEIIVQYLNRLSDYFFMLSRAVLHQEGKEETIWTKD